MKQESLLLRECLDHLNALPDIEAKNGNKNCITIRNCDELVDYVYKIQPDVTGTMAELISPYFQRFKRDKGEKNITNYSLLIQPCYQYFAKRKYRVYRCSR